ncbi:hypothetical protein GCM10010096_25690 [Alcaligenes pakistanensis]|uniref:Uncharacterized protein n=1 Tax=Alcaligenes pakistanensis TaxID=1482717 RepID=A0A8H9IMS9_9BURK|nr:hypothetical protein [Alcaligenes pakistanensis]GHC52445.1 hypothetical protein GCM10010096_25690 [Alcaligenes pakistanensis]
MATLIQEVQAVLDFIDNINPYEQQISPFPVGQDLWGQEDRIVEGVENVLRNEGNDEFTLSPSENFIHIERKQK